MSTLGKQLLTALEAMAKHARENGVNLTDREIDAELRKIRQERRMKNKNPVKAPASARR